MGCVLAARALPARAGIGRAIRAHASGLRQSFFAGTELDFIEKYAASSPRLDVKDCFLPEDLVGSFEGEPERPEISEGAPVSPHLGPVEQFEAI
jgi:hypothetical protein